jgi:hypothetical protein
VIGGGGAVTFTVTEEFTEPVELVAVSIYVVVFAGVTVLLPESATDPIPLFILTDVAFVVVQLKVEDEPEVMLVGEAERLAVGAGIGTGLTATITEESTEPLEFVAVMVYVVVAVGLTEREPEGATLPIPLFILIEVAFVVLHERVLEEPTVIDVGLAEIVAVGATIVGVEAVTTTLERGAVAGNASPQNDAE